MSKLYVNKAACEKKKKGTKTHPDENKNRAVPTEANGRRRLRGDKSDPCATQLHHQHQSGQFSRYLGFKAEGFLKGWEKKKKNQQQQNHK